MRLVSNNLGIMALIAGLSFWGTACNNSKVSGSDQTAATAVEEPGSTGGDVKVEEEEDELASSYGLLNFRQLAATYETVTGVQITENALIPVTDEDGNVDNTNSLLDEYNTQIASLPKSFDAATISASKVSAVTKLAAAFCDVLSRDVALMTAKFGSDSAAMALLGSSEYATTLLDAFYGPETALQGDRTEDTATVSALVDNLKTVPTAGDAAQAVFMGSCTAVLASAEFFIY